MQCVARGLRRALKAHAKNPKETVLPMEPTLQRLTGIYGLSQALTETERYAMGELVLSMERTKRAAEPAELAKEALLAKQLDLLLKIKREGYYTPSNATDTVENQIVKVRMIPYGKTQDAELVEKPKPTRKAKKKVKRRKAE